MSAFGVKINNVVGNMRRTPLEECGYVYKNLDHVLGVLKQQEITEVATDCIQSSTQKVRIKSIKILL